MNRINKAITIKIKLCDNIKILNIKNDFWQLLFILEFIFITLTLFVRIFKCLVSKQLKKKSVC